jgi:hypothetical protein
MRMPYNVNRPGCPGRFLFNWNKRGSHTCFLADKGNAILRLNSGWEDEVVGQFFVFGQSDILYVMIIGMPVAIRKMMSYTRIKQLSL